MGVWLGFQPVANTAASLGSSWPFERLTLLEVKEEMEAR